MKTLSLELNEINFEMMSKYFHDGGLENLHALVRKHGLVETKSEKIYCELEPWIQWVTVHTGLSYAEHGVFRLGDIVGSGLSQIWETLQNSHGISSVAISPMNAENKVDMPSIFIPDPWTSTPATGPVLVRWFYDAVRQLVNDNSSGRLTFESVLKLGFSAIFCVHPSSYKMLVSLFSEARSAPWKKALILDVLLANALVYCIKSGNHGFSSLFLNAGAHIQHHYWYSSKYYSGEQKNPDWYHAGGADPLHDAYVVYDWIVAFLMKQLPDWRIIISTGLSQLPNRKNLYYYRPYSHDQLLGRILAGVGFQVLPRMSRDFLVVPDNEGDLDFIKKRLAGIFVMPANMPLLSIDERADGIFCQIAYTEPLLGDELIGDESGVICKFADELVHVSIENAIHRSTGYMLDTVKERHGDGPMQLKELHDYLINAATS